MVGRTLRPSALWWLEPGCPSATSITGLGFTGLGFRGLGVKRFRALGFRVFLVQGSFQPPINPAPLPENLLPIPNWNQTMNPFTILQIGAEPGTQINPTPPKQRTALDLNTLNPKFKLSPNISIPAGWHVFPIRLPRALREQILRPSGTPRRFGLRFSKARP